MSAKDVIHDAVRNALIKDGWTITHDPYTIEYEGKYLYADLAAERTLAAERNGEKIIVEIKSFVGQSIIQDFKEMLGHYVLYLPLLAETASDYKLFVAVDSATYDNDFQHPVIRLSLTQTHVPLIVIETDKEEVVEWIK
jgi:hypothetical protein